MFTWSSLIWAKFEPSLESWTEADSFVKASTDCTVLKLPESHDMRNPERIKTKA